jgi:FO synthase
MSDAITVRSSEEIDGALSRVESSHDIDLLDAATLFSARGEQLNRLLEVASQLRDEGLARSGRAGIITYSKKVFIPITFLCRDRCHYCIFVETPSKLEAKGKPVYMDPDEILAVARRGAELGCKEALFTLGDRPEDRWPVARKWLDDHGYESTLDYIRAMAILVLEETGLLPHLNPGVMSWAELQRLRPVAPSMGMMLETTSVRLWAEKGGVHYGSPDKDPALRLRVLEDAGRGRIPFTTGLLFGIGETDAERADALFAIRASHERYGHIQETIIQNFRAKPRTAMQNEADLDLQEYVAAVAVARIVLGADATIQAPPNLTDANELKLLVRAGVSDWGGVSPVTADHVNPERPWPDLDDLGRLTRDAGFHLRERLTAQPPYVKDPETWVDVRVLAHLRALADPVSGLADENAPVVGRIWSRPQGVVRPSSQLTGDVGSALRKAAAQPSGLSDAELIVLLNSEGTDLDELCSVADGLREATVGNEMTFVVNRNIDSSLYEPIPSRDELKTPKTNTQSAKRLSPRMIGDLADEARALGATELCIQGAVPSALPGEAYLDLVASVRRRQPDIHVHAFRPAEIRDGASRLRISVREFLEAMRDAGVNSVPGSGARILDDRLRAILSERTDPPVSEWVDVMTTAHRVGLRSTATMIYGHVESAADQVAHLRRIVSIQDETGGFTEFIPIPFVPQDAPRSLAGIARPGPSLRETRAVHAVARLMLHGRVDHVQAAWTKLGLCSSQVVLRGGADDFGGLLLDGVLWPEAGAEAHRELTAADMHRAALEIGRIARQRTTDYGDPSTNPTVGHYQAPSPAVGHLDVRGHGAMIPKAQK